MQWLKWTKGRQNTDFDKPYKVMLLIPKWMCMMLHIDLVLIKYEEGVRIRRHVDNDLWWKGYDTVRTNIELTSPKKGGVLQFWGVANNPHAIKKRWSFFGKKAITFRPDIMPHSVTRVTEGERLVLSFGNYKKTTRVPIRSSKVAEMETCRDIETVVLQISQYYRDYVHTVGRFNAMVLPCTSERKETNKDEKVLDLVADMLYTLDPSGCEFSHEEARKQVLKCLPEEFVKC